MGEAGFFGLDLAVDRRVLVPRPETELLVEEALTILRAPGASKKPRILDIGTGSGAIAVSLTIEHPDCRMTALDIAPGPLGVARRNAARYGLARKIRFLRSDLFSVFEGKKGIRWDMIVSNPPYIPEEEYAALPREVLREPKLALSGGPGGLTVIERILDGAPKFLVPGGWLLMEIGEGQSGRLTKRLAKNSFFKGLRFIKDHAGIERILAVQRMNG